jgi:hypothetical protein
MPLSASAFGQAAPVIRAAVASAIAGAVCRPKPPCPASQKKPGAAASKPATGERSAAKVRRPAQRCAIRATERLV